MAKVTIEDISRHTGLSRGTVSRALNDRPDISQATKNRVLEACRKLNYAPSHFARSLATGRSYAVAVLCDSLMNAYAARFVRGVLSRAAAEKYLVHVVEWSERLDPEALVPGVSAERVDALLMTGAMPVDLEHVLREHYASRVLVSGAPLDGLAADVFAADQVEAGRLVARHLLATVGERLIYLHRGGAPGAEQRLAGFLEVVVPTGLVRADVVIELDNRRADAAVGAHTDRLLAARGIAAESDELALACVFVLGEGRKDRVIVGYGNDSCGPQLEKYFATIDPCAEEIGRRAMHAALQRVERSRSDAPATTLVAPKLLLRNGS